MVPSFFKVSLKRFLYLLAAYSLLRGLFLFWNWTLFEHASWGEIAYAFFLGLRFDTAAILLTNAPLFLLWFLPSRWLGRGWLKYIDLGLFALINWICLGTSMVDAEFVKFIGKRSSYDLLFLRDDVERQSFSILFTYWYFVVSLCVLTGLLVWVWPRFSPSSEREVWWKGTLWRLAAAFIIFTGIRGGYGFKPINPMEAYFSTKHELGLLVLNTPINLIKTRPNGKIERTRYFATDHEAITRLKNLTDLSRPPLALAQKWNVVILILESFGSEYVGVANDYPGYTPFFDSLAKKSIYFKYNFANARRSIEGLPAVICGLPSIMEEPIITSDFSSNRLDCMPKMLAQRGYSTYFLHGAHNGSMHFDSFSRLAGFENFVGLDEYPKGNPDDLDNYWGVLDEPMLQYATKVIDEAPKPVMLGLFTLSSHHPYYIPPKYAGKFPKGKLEIHESIGYTDYSLKKFFETAETKPWFKNTIFILTADHTQKSEPEHAEYMSVLGYYRVPLIFYIPGLDMQKLGVAKDRITQQIDIMPSVMDLLGITLPERLLVGQSVFDLAKPGRAYNYTTASYWLLEPHNMVQLVRPEDLHTFSHNNTYDRVEVRDEARFADAILNLKAVLHYMNEGLTDNSLYRWKEAP
jgi:phosphoglycerol transferase MdoB-like AlkP superfamily enzyme